jgi:hypothetical protein
MTPGCFEGLQYLLTSREIFELSPHGEMNAVSDPSWVPPTFAVRAKLEAAAVCAYKGVESIMGDPPKDNRKLMAILSSLGLNATELVGFARSERGRRPVIDVVRELNMLRDRRAAHACIPSPMQLSYSDVVEFQHFASTVLGHVVAMRAEKYPAPLEKRDAGLGPDDWTRV